MIFVPSPQPCIILPHVGVSFGRIGSTKKADVPESHQGTILNYDERGFVKSVIVIRGSNCKTQEGLGIGSTLDDVMKVYGKGTKAHLGLQKGHETVARVGDMTLRYKGISFSFSRGQVTMIALPSL